MRCDCEVCEKQREFRSLRRLGRSYEPPVQVRRRINQWCHYDVYTQGDRLTLPEMPYTERMVHNLIRLLEEAGDIKRKVRAL